MFLSFPVGFETVKSSLDSVPFLDEISLYFSACPYRSNVEFHRTIRQAAPHRVANAGFVRWDKRPSLGNNPVVQAFLEGGSIEHGYTRL